MEISLSTPALLFPAITLLLLAYTSRFLALANLVREFIQVYEKSPSATINAQIQSFSFRLDLIKFTQIFATLSFLSCVFCMFYILSGSFVLAKITFGTSLVLMIFSLISALYELIISTDALHLELSKLNDESSSR